MIISVASGKGGTGKTTVAVNLALSINNVQLLDCDVEEPNVHIFLKPLIDKEEKAVVPVPEVIDDKCTYCGRCQEVCAYNAIAVFPPQNGMNGNVLIFDNLCHSCGARVFLCPRNAITEINKEIGSVESGISGMVNFVHGKLNIGEARSAPLIKKVKEFIDISRTVIIDVSPGTSCPMVTTVKGSDFCILVTEPTPFGLNDLKLAVDVIKKLEIPFGVVLNRSDLGNDETDRYCSEENIPILMRIPFDENIAIAYSKGMSMLEVVPEYREQFRELYNNIHKRLKSNNITIEKIDS